MKCWAGWSKAGIQITGRNVSNFRYADDTTFMAESEEELKSHWMKVKEKSENGIKLNIQKTKIMASGPIISWEMDGETVGTVTGFILGGSKFIADGNSSYEIKRCLLLGRKVDQLRQHIKKQRHYFANRCASSQSYGFSSSCVWV